MASASVALARTVNAGKVKVNMGTPILEDKKIPFKGERHFKILDKEFEITPVSMGNPHAITVVDDVENFDVKKYGKILEVNEHFPKKANIEFIEIIDRRTVKMRVWERGTGETLACGTGTCATVAAACLNGISPREPVKVDLLGGQLTIEWNAEDGHIYMTGPAEFTFDGEYYNG